LPDFSSSAGRSSHLSNHPGYKFSQRQLRRPSIQRRGRWFSSRGPGLQRPSLEQLRFSGDAGSVGTAPLRPVCGSGQGCGHQQDARCCSVLCRIVFAIFLWFKSSRFCPKAPVRSTTKFTKYCRRMSAVDICPSRRPTAAVKARFLFWLLVALTAGHTCRRPWRRLRRARQRLRTMVASVSRTQRRPAWPFCGAVECHRCRVAVAFTLGWWMAIIRAWRRVLSPDPDQQGPDRRD